jgi:HEAT repeat protein
MKIIVPIVFVFCASTAFSVIADDSTEAQQIEILQSSANAPAKADACRRLKQIGTVKSVPVLARLLSDEHLSQAACDALETMPFEPAGEALLDLLTATSGKTRAGVIHALGERRESRALPQLAGLLGDPDPLVASDTSRALGKIGGSEAIQALRKAMPGAPESVSSAMVDAVLQCGSQLLTMGDLAGAAVIFQPLCEPNENGPVRMAAFAGCLRAAGGRGLALAASALEGTDPAQQVAALQFARDCPDASATAMLTNLFPKAGSAMQTSLLRTAATAG